MKILIDHQIFSFLEYGGISKYFIGLMNYYHTNRIEFDFSLKYSNNQHLSDAPFISVKPFFPGLHFPRKGLLLGAINSIESRKLLKIGDFKIFHPTYYDLYFLRYVKNKSFIVTIHDMIPELFHDNSFLGKLLVKNKRILMDNASKIIAVSQNTKNDILQFYDYNESDIYVVHHGINVYYPLTDYTDTNKYLLFIGNRGGYKNFDITIGAIATILQERQDLFLICAGGGSFSESEILSFKKLNIHNQIHHSPINDATLPFLYKNAICFIFPSLYEGFGIPILEAFSNGCPVILSNKSSFPEVAGDAAEYFDPHSEESIRKSVIKLLDDEKLRSNLIKRGLERVKSFSVKNMAEKTLDVYRSAL